MSIEVQKWDDQYWMLEIDGRIISYGLSWDEAQQLAAEWRGEFPWTPSWRFGALQSLAA